MEQKIQLSHPEGKKAVTMDKGKYELLKNAVTGYLKTHGTATHTELWRSIADDFKANKVEFDGSVQWSFEWVKLDLEAKKVIERVAGTLPEKYALST